MAALLRSFRRIAGDLTTFRHIEAYVVVGVGIALIAIDVLGEVPINVQLTVIIAALVVLVFRTTAPDVKHEDIHELLRNRNQFVPFREFIKGAKTLSIYAPSAINILRDAAPIKDEILEKGGKVTILLQNPHEDQEITQLQKQLDIAAVDLRNDIFIAVDILKRLNTRRDGTGYHLQYGFLPYSPGFSLLIVDADRASGRLIVEFFGFHNEFIGNRMHIQITRQQSEYWFEYWLEQFREMQKLALSP